MTEYNNFEYTCLFGGGAIRGTAHVGVIKALEDLGICPTTLAGSSVGSIIAALYAVGYSCDEIAEIFLSVNFELFRDIAFGFTPKFALSKGEIFLEWIRDLIEKKYYGQNYIKGEMEPIRFKDINRNLVIITTKMREFSCQEFSNFETPDYEIAMAVRISCCMPGLMRAVKIDDDLLVDGDLMKGKPMWYLSKNLQNSTDRILEVRLEGSFSGSDQSPIEYVNGMYSCMTYSETSFIKNIYGNRDKYDYLAINTGNVIVVDFNYPTEKRQTIIDEGYKQTVKYFREYLVSKKQNILSIYKFILDKMRKVQRFIKNKKYNSAKNSLAELFIYIAETKDIIDNKVYMEISKFQRILFENVKTGLLGYVNCHNKDLINSSLSFIIDDLYQRTNGIKEYLKKFNN